MSTQTVLYIILAGIIALLLALFQYIYKSKSSSKRRIVFAFLRFLSIFFTLLLLINPKFDSYKVYAEKPNLVVAIDNSLSVNHLNQKENTLAFVEELKNNKTINEKFNIEFYSFGETLNSSDSLSFNEQQSNIHKVFKALGEIYKNTVSPTVMVSDGNQTYGNDYEFSAKKYNQPIYPIILGDTITYTDLKISQLNVNKYAYLKNEFPIETIVLYTGNQEVISKFIVTIGDKIVFSKRLSFNQINNTQLINFTLPANRVGVQSYKAKIVPINSEKNKINNIKNFAIEVIDQKTKVAIVTTITHPDIGALKKSIEANEQRTVTFLKPNEASGQIDDFQLIILYQPNNYFRNLFKELKAKNKNKFIISGTRTDWRFLNSESKTYSMGLTNQTEEYQPISNNNYNEFIINDLDFNSYPPLYSAFGDVEFKIPIETILYKSVNGIDTKAPLLATFETNERREAILFGENIWKWRAQSYLNRKNFNSFDDFIGKIVQYLSSNKRKNRLNIEYKSFYEGSADVLIKAQFFNKNYEFDANETLTIFLKNKNSGAETTFPLILKNNNYQVDLSSLPASDYSFIVKATGEPISKSGTFKILEHSIEQQFLNANVTKLQKIAANSKGESYFISSYNSVFNDLIKDDRYKLIQKSTKNTVPLIDWNYLLFLIVLTLAIEWFLRKYKGLI